MVQFGPSDYGISIGLAGQRDHPTVVEAREYTHQDGASRWASARAPRSSAERGRVLPEARRQGLQPVDRHGHSGLLLQDPGSVVAGNRRPSMQALMARSYSGGSVPTSPPEVQLAAREAIQGKTHGLRAILPFLGPAFIASIAYIDPGNFATNISAGAQFGYALLWVILLANLMAMLIQGLAAKLGIATGMNLAEMCRARFPPWVCYFLWLTQEVTAMATDLAEFLGASIGINLLTGCRWWLPR